MHRPRPFSSCYPGVSSNAVYKARMLRNVNKTLLTVIVACVLLNSPNQLVFFAYNMGYKVGARGRG